MKPGVPWSVKGIEPDARAAAKVAARQAGMTLGQWLNQVILDAGADDNGNDNTPSNVDDITAYRLKKQNPGDQDVSELHSALTEMAELFKAAEEHKSATLDEIDQTLSSMAERIDHVEHDETSESLSALQELQKAQGEILSRLESIEQNAKPEQESSPALTGALSKVMAHLETSERQSVGGMQAVERAITRLVDRMDAIEQDKNTSAEMIGTALQHMHSRMENRESQYQEDQRSLAERLEAMQDRLGKVETRAGENRALKDNLAGLISSIESANQKSAAVQTNQLLESALRRLEALEARLAQSTQQNASDDVAQAQSAIVDDIGQTIDEAAQRLEALKAEPQPAEPITTDAAPDTAPTAKPDTKTEAAEEPASDAPTETNFRKTKRPSSQPNALEKMAAVTDASDSEDTSLFRRTMRRANDIISTDFAALLRAPKDDTDDVPESARFIRTNIFDSDDQDDDQKTWTRSGLMLIILLAFGAIASAISMIVMDTPTPATNEPLTIERPTAEPAATNDTNSTDILVPTRDPNAPAADIAQPDLSEAASATALSDDQTLPDTSGMMALSAQNYGDLDTLMKSAEGGDINAAYLLGLRYYNGDGVKKNDALAASYFAAAANQGLAPAQYRYALHLERGLGVQRSPAKALGWYEAAAILGHRKAMYNLAVLYANGSGTDQDLSLARQWFEEAAEYDLQDAKYNLGILYLQGKGGDQNLIDAYQWFTLAAQNGDQDAAKQVKQIESQLDLTQLGTARAKAQNWSPRSLDPQINFDTPRLN